MSEGICQSEKYCALHIVTALSSQPETMITESRLFEETQELESGDLRNYLINVRLLSLTHRLGNELMII